MKKQMKSKLEEIISNLKINSYQVKDNKFISQKHSSSALVMKALIQITSELDKKNIKYDIDSNYDIDIIDIK